jgi:hypothetical protein
VADPFRFAHHERGDRAYVRDMTEQRQRLGRRAETLVARELRRRGWRIVARNARPAQSRSTVASW